jgi:hypothetical protein
MSKKVVRLTESQLRLMINKVIKEQKAPVSSPATAQTNPNDKQKAIEALTKMNTPAYVSKFHPGYILTPNNDLKFYERTQKWSLTVNAFSVVDKMVGGYVIFTYLIDSPQSLESATLQEIMEGINSGKLNVRIQSLNNEINTAMTASQLIYLVTSKLNILQVKQLMDAVNPDASKWLTDGLTNMISGNSRLLTTKGEISKAQQDLKQLQGQ